jgi:RND family efflux transporter MFP subunit
MAAWLLLTGAVAVLPSQALSMDAAATSPALTVRIVKPETLDWAQSIPANGWLAAWQEAVISAEASLKIVDIKVEVGSIVKKGDILVQLEQPSVLADLHKQEAAVATAKANLAEAEANAERARKVKGTGALSDQQVNEYLIAEETAKATVASENAALESQQIKLQQTTIRAVDDGIISSSSATLGAVVSSGTELFRLIRQQKIEWQAEIPAQYINDMHVGLKARIDVPDGRKVYGTIRRVGPTVSKDTGRAIVYVALPLSDKPKAGFNVSGAIELDQTPALTVPETSLVFDDGMSYVFTADADGHVSRHKVEIGRRSNGRAEVLGGIKSGAWIVESGGAFLSDGSTVRIVSTEEAAR